MFKIFFASIYFLAATQALNAKYKKLANFLPTLMKPR